MTHAEELGRLTTDEASANYIRDALPILCHPAERVTYGDQS